MPSLFDDPKTQDRQEATCARMYVAGRRARCLPRRVTERGIYTARERAGRGGCSYCHTPERGPLLAAAPPSSLPRPPRPGRGRPARAHASRLRVSDSTVDQYSAPLFACLLFHNHSRRAPHRAPPGRLGARRAAHATFSASAIDLRACPIQGACVAPAWREAGRRHAHPNDICLGRAHVCRRVRGRAPVAPPPPLAGTGGASRPTGGV